VPFNTPQLSNNNTPRARPGSIFSLAAPGRNDKRTDSAKIDPYLLNRLSLVDSTLGASFEEDFAKILYITHLLNVLQCWETVDFYQGDFKSSWKSKSSERKNEKHGSIMGYLQTRTIKYGWETPKLLEMTFMRRSVC
jgi:hypothetical protein